jgi:transposase
VTLEQITQALGGSAGSRLAQQLGILASGATLLRQLRRRAFIDCPRAPRVLGIDDWAWRKGRRYGTILCDLELSKVIDLLPDRSAESMEQWLHAHPGAEIISRDRASLYAEAATNAAPQAVQVADRWHLLHNLSDTLAEVLAPHHRLLTEVAHDIAKQKRSPPQAVVEVVPLAEAAKSPTRSQRLIQHNRERRMAHYETVMELVERGLSQCAIARQCGMDRKTVREWIRAQGFPERKPRERRSLIDPHVEYLKMRWEQGCCNGRQLWRELKAQGFQGRPGIVRSWVSKHYGSRRGRDGQNPSASVPLHASPRKVTWLLLKEPEEARHFLEELYRRSPQIATIASLAREFFRIVRERDTTAWPAWRDAAAVSPFVNFTQHLCRDEAAFLAALQQPWSNGPVEGHIHRLKLIKRSMYGRAKFDLLRVRVLHAA